MYVLFLVFFQFVVNFYYMCECPVGVDVGDGATIFLTSRQKCHVHL